MCSYKEQRAAHLFDRCVRHASVSPAARLRSSAADSVRDSAPAPWTRADAPAAVSRGAAALPCATPAYHLC